ncbi:MAG: nucleotidyltransferase domain-containing protein [Defluviitaleaceae bacterium]|nr:nucleotidyltransferase domain-containing protein [Defluviitaleaceae bacterium]
MENKFALPDDVYKQITAVLQRYPEIKCVKIFGSRAKGIQKRYSDVDIAVFSETERDLSPCIKDDLDDLDVIYNFDVLHYEKITCPDVKAHIDRAGILLQY